MSTMSNEEIIKVVQASMDGAVIQVSANGADAWHTAKFPYWDFHCSVYRVKELTIEELTIEEFIEAILIDESWNRSYHAACNDILDNMKNLQGEDND